MNKELITQAIARGWCSDKNANKEMDTDLADSIVEQVALLISDPAFIESLPTVIELRAKVLDDERWLKHYSDHANLCSQEGIEYQKRIRNLESKLAEAQAQLKTSAQNFAQWFDSPSAADNSKHYEIPAECHDEVRRLVKDVSLMSWQAGQAQLGASEPVAGIPDNAKVVLWYCPLDADHAKPDGRCYDIMFCEQPGYIPLYTLQGVSAAPIADKSK